MKKGIANILKKLLLIVFRLFDLLIPTDKSLIGFGSDNGSRFSGNPKHLFLYFRQQPDIQCFWVTKSKSLYKSLKDQYGNEVVLADSPRGIFLLAKAGWFFMSHGSRDHGHFPIYSTTRVIQTWHGKPYKLDGLTKATISENEASQLKGQHGSYYAMMASSAFCKYYYSSAFSVPATNILPLGCARDDGIIEGTIERNLTDKAKALKEKLGKAKKVILYAPTYRDNGTCEIFPFEDRDMKALDRWLSENNCVILLRHHINDSSLIQYEISSIIPYGFDICEDVYDILNVVDILVSDYSSLYCDFLLLNRPSIFLDYDFEDFCQERGIALPIESISAGSHPKTQAEFISAIRQAIYQPEAYAQERHNANLLYNEWSKGTSRKDMYAFVMKANTESKRLLPVNVKQSKLRGVG